MHVQAYYSFPHLTFFLALVDFVITSNRVNISFNWDLIFGDELGPSKEVDNKRLFLLHGFSNTNIPFPHDYYQLIHDYLVDPTRSGLYVLDGVAYSRAALAIFSHYKQRSSSASSHDSVLLHVLSFLLPRASKSERLIIYCRQAKFQVFAPTLSFEPTYITAGRQAVQNYLQKMGAMSLLPEVYTVRNFISSFNSYS